MNRSLRSHSPKGPVVLHLPTPETTEMSTLSKLKPVSILTILSLAAAGSLAWAIHSFIAAQPYLK